MNRYNIGINWPKQSQMLPALILIRIAISYQFRNQIAQATKHFIAIENLWIFNLILIELEIVSIIMILGYWKSSSYDILKRIFIVLTLFSAQILLFAPSFRIYESSTITNLSLWLLSISFIFILNIFLSIINQVVEFQNELFLIYIGLIFIQILYISTEYFTSYIECIVDLLFLVFYLSISLANFIYFGAFYFEKYLLKLPGYNQTLNFYREFISDFLSQNESGYLYLFIGCLLYIVDVVIVYAVLDNWPPWMWIEICIFFISVTFTCLLFLNDNITSRITEKSVRNNLFACYFQLQLYYNFYELLVYFYPDKFETLEILMRKY
ncbi:unnamed protein product [Blepharisma stoltei]|uniref:Uncharacterized protein n=1 Tax=Blepharisma stoltei TaxID=1481888 RepID=A0AAU9IIF3_9CILI|nr:unnamed protein product [Blepharisma stoltei]